MNAVGEKDLHGSASETSASPVSPARKPSRGSMPLPVRPLLGAALAVLVTLAVLGGFLGLRSLEGLEAGLNDRLRVILSPYSEAQDPRISILTVTEDTLALFPYRSPVDRDFLASIVEILDEAGAKAIGIDILFDQATEPGKDDRLARAIAHFQGPAVMAWADAKAGLRPRQEEFLDAYIARSGGAPGFATVIYDADGVVRRFETHEEGTEIGSFPARLAELTGVTGFPESGLIDWRRETAEGAPAFQTVPSQALLNPALPKAMFKGWFGGRYVLIGADLEQLDRHRTSLAADPTISRRTSAGVVVHAHALSQFLDGRVVRNFGIDGWQGAALVALMSGLGALLGLAGGSILPKLIGLLLTGAAYVGTAAALSRLGGPYLPVAPPLLALGLAFGVSGAVDAFLVGREKRFIRQAFSHYLEPAMVDRLARDRSSLRLGGERREISFLFTDIEGFTSMAERLEPERLTALLNDYFDGMSDIIGAHGGAIDKFIGDAVVALFGALTSEPDHALRALRCAAELDAFAESFRRVHAADGLGRTRIGVHTGVAAVGNFGGRKRFDYTAMGDAMNIAARIESFNKTLGARVSVSGANRAAALGRNGARGDVDDGGASDRAGLGNGWTALFAWPGARFSCHGGVVGGRWGLAGGQCPAPALARRRRGSVGGAALPVSARADSANRPRRSGATISRPISAGCSRTR